MTGQVALVLLAVPGCLAQIQTGFKRTKPFDLSGIEQGCKTTGFQERIREICEEVTDRVCTVSRAKLHHYKE